MISVIMGIKANNDRIAQIKRSVLSIINQDITESVELIICDNGSDAGIQKYLDNISVQYDNIKIIRESRVVSLQQKLNYCLQNASGDYIARMDDDDYSYPNRFSIQYEFLKKHSDIAFVGSNIIEVGLKDYKKIKKFPEYPQIKDFKMTQPYIHSSLMFRKQCLLDIGGYSESKWCESCDDYDLLLRLYKKNYIGANIQVPLIEYCVYSSKVKKIPLKYRVNQAATRYKRFKDFNKNIVWFFYILKPIILWFLPLKILNLIKSKRGD